MNLDEVHIIHLDISNVFFLQWEQSITRGSYSGLWLSPCHWMFPRRNRMACYIISFRVSFVWQVDQVIFQCPFQSGLFNDSVCVSKWSGTKFDRSFFAACYLTLVNNIYLRDMWRKHKTSTVTVVVSSPDASLLWSVISLMCAMCLHWPQ